MYPLGPSILRALAASHHELARFDAHHLHAEGVDEAPSGRLGREDPRRDRDERHDNR
jgi:hypothetical protein